MTTNPKPPTPPTTPAAPQPERTHNVPLNLIYASQYREQEEALEKLNREQYLRHAVEQSGNPMTWADQKPAQPGRTFWENPLRVARYHQTLQAAPPGWQPPPWLDTDSINNAYKYFEEVNKGRPWQEWDYPADDDPIVEQLRSIPLPDPRFVKPEERELYYSLQEPPPGEYIPDPNANQDQVFGVPRETWDQLPGWQKAIIPALPWVGRTIGAGGGAIAGASIGGPAGAVAGAVAGGGLAYGAEKNKTLADAMNVLDVGAETVERTIGTLSQILDSTFQPEKYGPLKEVLGNLPAAWEAAHLTQDVSFAQLTGPEVTGWELGNPEPQTWTPPDGQAASSYALTQARREIMAGASPEQVWEKWAAQFGFSGTMRDLVGHMLLDPLNKLGDATKLIGSKAAKAAGNLPLETAFKTTNEPLYALRAYGNELRQMPQAEAAQFGSLSKWIAGLDSEGNLKDFSTKPIRKGPAGILDYMTGLTPAARATEVLHYSVDGLNVLVSELAGDDPARMIQLVKAVSGVNPHEAVSILDSTPLPRWFQSAEAQAVPLAIRDQLPKLEAMLDQWKIARPNATILKRIADITGQDPSKLIADLYQAKSGQAGTIYRQLVDAVKTRADGGDQGAQKMLKTLTEDRSLSALDGQKLKQMADGFFGPDGAPYHPADFKARLMVALAEGLDGWAAKWFNVKPNKGIVRIANVVKKAQGLALLGLNPTYLINNSLNNIVTLAWDGLLGFSSHGGRMRFLRDMGIAPTRLRSGLGAAEMGEILDAGLAAEAQRLGMSDFQLGKGIREAGRAGDLIQTMDDFAKKGDKLAVFANLSQKVERWSSEMAMVNAMREFWDRRWKAGDGFSKMDGETRLALNSIQDGLAEKIERAIARGKSKKQIEEEIFTGLGRKSLRDVLDGNELSLLDHYVPDLSRILEAKLRKAKTDEDVRTAFRNARQEIISAINRNVIWELQKFTEEAATRANLEKTQGVLDSLDQIMGSRHDFWLQHFATMDRVAEEASRAVGGARRAIWDNALREADTAWNAFENMEGAKWLGLFRGLGAAEGSDEYIYVLTRLTDMHDNWSQFYTARRTLMNNFFDQAETLEKAERSALWGETNRQLNSEYAQALLEEDRLQQLLDLAFVDQYGRQMIGQSTAMDDALNWRLSIRMVRRKMAAAEAMYRNGNLPEEIAKAWGADVLPAEVVNQIRSITKGIPPYLMPVQDRDAAAKDFYKVYTSFIREMLDAGNRNAPGGMPKPPTPEASPMGGAPVPVEEIAQPIVTPPAKPIDFSQEILRLARENGIPTATNAGAPNDRYLLNILRQAGYAVDDLNQATPDMAENAFRVWAASHTKANPEQIALDRQLLAERARQIESNIERLQLEAPRRFTREATAREIYDHFADQPEKADAVIAVMDQIAETWARENGKTRDEWYETFILERGGVEAGEGLRQLSPTERQTVELSQHADDVWKVTYTADEIGADGLPYGIRIVKEADDFLVIDLSRNVLGRFRQRKNALAYAVNDLPTRGFNASDMPGYFPERTVERLFTNKDKAERFARTLKETGEYLYQLAPVNRSMTRAELDDYARAILRLGEDEVRRALRYEPSRQSKIALIDAVHRIEPQLAEKIAMEPGMLQQSAGLESPKGLTRWMDTGQAVVHAFESADVSTFMHEIAHVWLPMLGDEDLGLVERWLREEYKLDLTQGWQHGTGAVEAKEKFARAFEHYLAEGKAPTPQLFEIFEKFKAWMLDIYRAITGSDIDIKLNDDIRTVFDKWMGEAEAPRLKTGRDITEEEYLNLIRVAQDWQYLVYHNGGMARKSDLEDYLTEHFGIDRDLGHTVGNRLEQTFNPSTFDVDRPRPRIEDYPDILGRYGTKAPDSPAIFAQKSGQTVMFGAGEDLPLFTGAPARAADEVFNPPEVNRQETLWDMRPQMKGSAVESVWGTASVKPETSELVIDGRPVLGMKTVELREHTYRVYVAPYSNLPGLPNGDDLVYRVQKLSEGGAWREIKNYETELPDLVAKAGAALIREVQQRPKALFQASPALPPGSTFAFGTDPNRRYEFKYRLVDLDELITSHTDDLVENVAFPKELQPRDRERAASQMQINKIASTLEPESLLLDTHQIDRGPMIVGPDGIVESGNGRVLALRAAKRDHPENWTAYQQALREKLADYGLSEADLQGMQNPVLVRERSSDVDRLAFAREANDPATLGMSAVENALSDAGRIREEALANLVVGDDWTIDQALRSAENRDFVRTFVAALPENERAKMIDGKGELSSEGMTRIRQAILMHVFPGEAGIRLSRVMIENANPQVKNLQNVIYASLPKLARAEGLVRMGARAPEYSIADDLAKAVDMYARLKQGKKSISDYLAQLPMIDPELSPVQQALLRYINESVRKPRRIRQFLEAYADQVVKQADVRQMGMFEQFTPLTKPEMLDHVARSIDQEGKFAETAALQIEAERARQEALEQIGSEPAPPNPEAAPKPEPAPAVGAPLGTVDSLHEPPLTDALLEGYLKEIDPLLAKAEAGLTDSGSFEPGGVYDLGQLDPVTMRGLKKYMGQVYSEMADTKLGAIRWGETRRDAALLNYSRRYGFDNVLGSAMPYEFWYTRSMLQWALRALTRPAILANYARVRNFAQEQIERPGFPTRLKRKMGFNLPFLPDWMGEGIYADPLRQVFPFEQLARPFEQWSDQKTQEQRRAEWVLDEMLTEEEITEEDYDQALQTQSGPAWSRALAQARNEIEAEITNPLDFAFTMIGPSLPISISYNLLMGRKDRISQLPATRFIQATTGALGIGGPRGVNLEGPLRKATGLPEVDRFEDYRVDRMLANLTAEGLISPDEAQRAMIDRTGPAFELAQQRVSQMRTWQYFGAPLGVDFFPEGEQEQRQLKLEYDRAIKAWKEGDDDALRAFFDTYPEYESRMASFQEPEERLKKFMIAEVWDRYTEMTDLHKRQVREQLGDVFQEALLDKETRSYDSIDLETLALWAQMLGGKNPQAAPRVPQLSLSLAPDEVATAVQAYNDERSQKFPEIFALQETLYSLPPEQQEAFRAQNPQLEQYYRWKNQYLATHPQIIEWTQSEESELYGLDPKLQQLVYQYRAEKDQRWPNLYQLQNAYFALATPAEKKAFRISHPELPAYWEFRKNYAATYPKIAPYILSEDSLAEMILGEMRSGSGYSGGGGGGSAKPKQERDYLTQREINQFSPPLLRQLYGYFQGGQELSEGAINELNRLWETFEKPGGDYRTWLDEYVAKSFRQ
jgi:hypothetical protein